MSNKHYPLPLPNSRASGRSEVGGATLESSLRAPFNEILTIFFKGLKSGQGQVMSQNRHFSHYHQDGTNDSCEPKLCQNVSQGMKKVPYKYRPYNKQSSRSKSGKVRSPNENTAQVSCYTRFMGH